MSRLCYTFQNIADRVWQAIADAHQNGLSYGEETITETNLLELKRYHPRNIKIRAFSKQKEEPKTGADWEWWIGGKGRWLGMRIQAKKIKYPGECFYQLQTYKTKSMTAPQIDVLIHEAAKDRLNPVYCLYVSSNRIPRMWATTCCWHLPRPLHMGCLIGDAAAVRATDSNKLNDLAHVCHPWHCLVCDCPCCPSSGGRLADTSFAVLQSSRQMAAENPNLSLPDAPIIEPQQRLPEYLMPLAETETAEESDVWLRERAEERGLSGFMILQEGGAI